MTEDSDAPERPDEWPEMYSAAGRSAQCPHQMHWVVEPIEVEVEIEDGDTEIREKLVGRYRCIYECGEIDEEPPSSKINS
jgi:hypothetical protein